MKKREILFNAYIPALNIMLESITLYNDRMMGLFLEQFTDELPDHHEYDYGEIRHINKELDINELVLTVMEGEDWVFIESEHFIPLQLIGQKDKEGVKIFEGDILSEPVEVDGKMVDSIMPVFYSEKEAAYCIDISYEKDQSSYDLLRDEDLSQLRVIGNIYKNKNLLNHE